MGSSADIVMSGKRTSGDAKRKPRPPGGTVDSSVPLSVIGTNLKRLRTRQGHSLERLAKHAGVSRAMLSQIETGRSVPTIILLLKVANALGVPLATLLSTPQSRRTTVLAGNRAKILTSSGGRFTSRALFPPEAQARAEFYEARIAARHSEALDPHAAGTRENLVVAQGRVELTVGSEQPVLLGEGDAAHYQADVPRSCRNPGSDEAVLYLVVSFAAAR